MLALHVRVQELDGGGTHETYAFHRSPVRVGRGELNDLRLDYPYVSNWHGLIQFDDEGIRFVDLGSTNGSFLDGVRLDKNVQATIQPSHELLLGRLQLVLSRESAEAHAPAPPAPPHSVTMFARRVALDQAVAGALSGRLEKLAREEAGAPALPVEPAAPHVEAAHAPAPHLPAPPPPSPLPPPPPAPVADSPALLAALDTASWQLGVLHDACKQADENFTAALDQAIAFLSEPEQARARVLAAERFPNAPGQPAAAAPPAWAAPAPVVPDQAAPPRSDSVRGEPVEPRTGAEWGPGRPPDDSPGAATALLRVFAEAYLGPEAAPRTPEAQQALLSVLAEVLETAARGYLELRSGYEQFAREIGIRLPRSEGAIGKITDANQLVTWLLQPTDGEPRAHQLGSAFADLMIHQVGLLNGVQAGGRALLDRLSPGALTREVEKKGGFGIGLRPLREAALWRALEEKFQELTEEDNAVTDVLFGKEFARAYAALTGRRPTGDSDPRLDQKRR
ncbi:MAG: FHA domain-containing protein [Anaeromyxobacter sp.]